MCQLGLAPCTEEDPSSLQNLQAESPDWMGRLYTARVLNPTGASPVMHTVHSHAVNFDEEAHKVSKKFIEDLLQDLLKLHLKDIQYQIKSP
jgi:hypothetical protein